MYMPISSENIDKAIIGDFSYYGSYETWERFGIKHPEPRYIIIHEKRLELSIYDYDVDYFNNRQNKFELMNVIEGKVEGDRTFIYKIIK